MIYLFFVFVFYILLKLMFLGGFYFIGDMAPLKYFKS